MNIRIIQTPTGGNIRAIPSKSIAHRKLIAAYLSGVDFLNYGDGLYEDLSEDLSATINCLKAMKSYGEGSIQLPCGESGSTLRFLIPVAAVLGIEADFVCEGRLSDRPLEEFRSELARHGVHLTGHNTKHLKGRLSGGMYSLPGDISSQYFSALLMALPLAETDSEIVVEGKLESRPYIDLTVSLLKKAGVSVKETEGGFLVPGRQQYRLSENELNNIEGDWSSAAFWLVGSTFINGSIRCMGLDDNSLQGDKEIKHIIKQIGQIDDARQEKFSIDVSDIPDLVPAIALLACGRPTGSITEITNAGRLRMKESDRLAAITVVLNGLGADIREFKDSLTIISRGGLTGGMADSHNDHRIAMMAAIASCISVDPVTICGAEAVSKSYSAFYEDFLSVGGIIEWL